MSDNQDKLESLRKFAKLLDSQFSIPGTKYRFGLDPLLSLVPVLGTFSGLLTGCILVLMAHRKGVSGKVKVLMLKNLMIDYFFGLIPIYGNIKDFFYKANQKNMLLIEEHLAESKHQGSGIAELILFIFLALTLFIGSLFFVAWVITSILNKLS